MVRAGEAQVWGRHAEGSSGLQIDDSVELPATEDIARQVVAREESLSFSDGQIPREVSDEAMANVEWRIGGSWFAIRVLEMSIATKTGDEGDKWLSISAERSNKAGEAKSPPKPNNFDDSEIPF